MRGTRARGIVLRHDNGGPAMRTSGRGVVVALLPAPLLGTTACGSGGSDGAAPRATSAAPSAPASPAVLQVTSAIADGAVLSAALPWQASVKADMADSVSRVEFVVDGNVRWTEKSEPYVFDDDGELLTPWLLGNGTHVLSVRAVAGSGAEGVTTARVTVRANTSANAQIEGNYRRTVTSADAQRVATYRTADKGAFGDVPPVGEWTINVLASGRIEGHDPIDPTVLFEEPFTVSGNQLRLYGPAVWVQPDTTEPDLFCEPEQPSDYIWRLSGRTLTISAVQKACADRDMVIAGNWTRTGP